MLDFLTKGETDVNSNGTIASAILLGTIGIDGIFIAARILDQGSGFGTVLSTTVGLMVISFFLLMIPIRAHDRALAKKPVSSG